MSLITYKIPIGSVVLPAARVGPPAYNPATKSDVQGTYRDYGVLTFDADTQESVMIECPVSDIYTGGSRYLRIRWRSPSATGQQVKWAVEHEPTGSGEQFDETYSASNSAITSVPGTPGETVDTVITLSGNIWSAGDSVHLHIYRDADDGSDTHTDDAVIVSIDVLYDVPINPGGGILGGFEQEIFQSASFTYDGTLSTIAVSGTPDNNSDIVDLRALFQNGNLVPDMVIGSAPSADGEWRINVSSGELEVYGDITGDADEYTLRYPVEGSGGGGGSGVDTYTAINEYYIDPDGSEDSDTRTYLNVEDALSAAVAGGDDPIHIRLAGGVTHAWDGSNLDADTNTFIYCIGGQPTLNLAGASILSNGTLHIRGVTISGTITSLGVSDLLIEGCDGDLVVSGARQTPDNSVTSWLVRNSKFDSVQLTSDAAASQNITVRFNDCWLEASETLWDHNGIDDNCDLYFERTHIRSVNVDTLLDVNSNFFAYFIDSTIRFQNTSNSTVIQTASTNGPCWVSTRIIEDECTDKGGNSFSFGSPGTQNGLSIDFHSSDTMPTDAPDKTRAQSVLNPSYGDLVFNEGSSQWRGPNRSIYLDGSVSGTGTDTLSTIFENDDIVDLDVSASPEIYRVKGEILIDGNGEDAVFDVDFVVRADSGPNCTILAGSVPTLIYADNVGQYSVTINAETSPVGFSIDVNKSSGGSLADISARLQISEQSF